MTFINKIKFLKTDAKRFYREISRASTVVKESTTEKEMKTFRQNIWSEKQSHNECASLIENIIRNNKGISRQQWGNIEEGEVAEALKKSHKWRSLRVD